MAPRAPVRQKAKGSKPPAPGQAASPLPQLVPALAQLSAAWLLLAILEVGLSDPDPRDRSQGRRPVHGRQGWPDSLQSDPARCRRGRGRHAAFMAGTSRSPGRSSGASMVRRRSPSLGCLGSRASVRSQLDGVLEHRRVPRPPGVPLLVTPPCAGLPLDLSSVAIGVVAATLATAAMLAWWIPRAVAALRPAVQRRLVMTVACVAGVCVADAAAGQLAHGASAQGGLNRSSYVVARDEHTAPLVHALADLLGSAAPSATPSSTSRNDPSRVIRRPIISMDQLLARVDRGRVKPWNVLMIQVESLRSDQLRVYGGTRDVMPTLDALARESQVFTNAYIQASHSNYADLVPLSSQYPLRSGEVYTYRQPDLSARPHLQRPARPLGYKTAIVSSQNENWGGMINFHRPEPPRPLLPRGNVRPARRTRRRATPDSLNG